ncbi:hypothetical protein [Vibrio sp.]|uniref:hypothetical protein n=1 Tax=Vibrio sp. TaxID=678 RepID=UPI003D1202A0
MERPAGVSQSAISRELARNSGERGYRHKQAQEKAQQRRREANKPTKMTPAMISIIEEKLRLDWSPEQVSGWLLTSHLLIVSHETIYQQVWADKKAGGDLYKHLRCPVVVSANLSYWINPH